MLNKMSLGGISTEVGTAENTPFEICLKMSKPLSKLNA